MGIMGRTLVVRQDGTGDYHRIQDAIRNAVPGDTVLVYGGLYREEVVFPRGGDNEITRITLKAAPGENVTITGANQITDGWNYNPEFRVYCLDLPKEYFSNNAEDDYFNPFAVQWKSKGNQWKNFFSCGCVYLNDRMMDQKWSKEDVAAEAYTWLADVDTSTGETRIYANFGGENPCNHANLIEINTRMQCITAKWNQSYITIDGLKVIRGCGPKTIDFWMTGAEAMYGAIATNGGHHWIIENCEVAQCRGVAIDFGCGSAKQEIKYGGEPKLYGHHIIRNNYVHDNGTNGMMAYRGAYTEICGNRLVNNNALNTGLLSEAYIKDVSGGWGIYIHDNYLYSDQDWSAFPLWLDSECDMCRFSRNIVYCKGDGRGFTSLDYECNSGWNLIDNNVLVGVGMNLCSTSSTYFVNNLWLNMDENSNIWPSKMNTGMKGAEGFDGYTRSMRIVEPGTLHIIGKNQTSRWENFNHDNKMLNNLFFGRGLSSHYSANPGGDAFSDMTAALGAKGECLEPSENSNCIYGEMILNIAVDEKTGQPLANPDYSGGTWKGALPWATEAEKLADRNYNGIFAWIPADEEGERLHRKRIRDSDSHAPYGNECDFNVYCAGAERIDNPEYGVAHGYIADTHSVVSAEGSYHIAATPETFVLTLTVEEKAAEAEVPIVTGQMLGAPACYLQAASKYIENYSAADYLPETPDVDFFGKQRNMAENAAGPFSRLEGGANKFQCWPKYKNKEEGGKK